MFLFLNKIFYTDGPWGNMRKLFSIVRNDVPRGGNSHIKVTEGSLSRLGCKLRNWGKGQYFNGRQFLVQSST